MSMLLELSPIRQEELLREAASRQIRVTLSCRLRDGWVAFQSSLLGLDRGTGDLVVAYPVLPEHAPLDVCEGQCVGVSFRRGSRRCVLETQVTGRCHLASGIADEVPALRLLWPSSMCELQRRLYYRTPVPDDVHVPAEVWRSGQQPGDSSYGQVLRGMLRDLSAGGLGLSLRHEDNPHWSAGTRVGCAFVVPGSDERLEVLGETRYTSSPEAAEVCLGVQFLGLDTAEESRPTLNQILNLTCRFQKIEMSRAARS